MDKSNLEVFMELIIHSGNGKSDAFEAIQLAKEGNFEQAEEKWQRRKRRFCKPTMCKQTC